MLRAFLVGRTVRITLALCQLWPSLEHGDRINRKLPLLPMNLQFEVIRQQLLQHLLHLLQAGLALYVRHAAYVVPIGPKPRRPVHDLPRVNPISSRKNLAHALIPYGNVPPVGTEPIAFVVRIAWFDRCDLKPRMRISGHHLARLRSCPRTLCRLRHPEPNHHADEHHNQNHPHNQLHPSPPSLTRCLFQFAPGRSTWSTTSTSAGAFTASSFSPICSWIAANSPGGAFGLSAGGRIL